MVMTKHSVDAKQLLRESKVFSKLSDAQLESIAAIGLITEYEAGETIFHEGEPAEELFVINEGKVALQITLQKQEGRINHRITVDIADKNDVVGWSAAVEPHRYTLTAICLQKVTAFSVSGEKLTQLMQGDTEVGYQVLKGLITVVASRLDDARQVLVSERLLKSKSP